MLTCLLMWLGVLFELVVGTSSRTGASLQDMPGHPEKVAPIGDYVADTAFWDLAEALLDDPAEPNLADVNDRWGWMR